MSAGPDAASFVVAIGGSSGAHRPLTTILGALTSGFRGALLVALHRHASSDAILPQIMSPRTELQVREAVDDAPVEPGVVYFAPPDQHLMLDGDRIRLSRGPRENCARPAIDVTFRSVGVERGPRAAAVLLSGLLNDGAHGLRVVADCGGTTVVQDPDDAEYAEMPERALQAVEPDHVLKAENIAAALMRFQEQLPPAGAAFEVPQHIRIEAGMAAGRNLTIATENRIGENSDVTCPECGGVLWQMTDGQPLRFRCHTGHAFTADVLAASQTEKIENAMWTAMRTLREKADTLRRLEEGSLEGESRRRWAGLAAEADAQADRIAESLVTIGRSG